MQILLLAPPGKFPTLNHDPGGTFSVPKQFPGTEVDVLSVNYFWWLELCKPSIQKHLLAGHSFSQRFRQRAEWATQGIDLKKEAQRAQESLIAFQKQNTYQQLEVYRETVKDFSIYLETLSNSQSELNFSLFDGPIIRGLDYSDSKALCAFAQQDSLLYRLIKATLQHNKTKADVILFKITSAQDLLSAMLTARCINELYESKPYICLTDHGYENFSLHIYLDEIRKNSSLTRFFDSIIISKDRKETVLQGILHAVKRGEKPAGFLDFEDINYPLTVDVNNNILPKPQPTFSPVSILWTRLSEKKCYWSKCTFCVQNSKHLNPKPVSPAELSSIVNRVKSLNKQGYEYFIFSDEALSPGFLKQFSLHILKEGLSIKWSCRCRIEHSFNREIFQLMKQAGCYEILFGLESSSSRVLNLMKKHINGLDLDFVKAIFRQCSDSGIAIHVTMITGFPGETLKEAEHTVDFAIDALQECNHATYKLNYFALFPDTPIAHHPEDFGVLLEEGRADLPAPMPFSLKGNDQTERAKITGNFERLSDSLDYGLGWGNVMHAKDNKFLKKNDALYMYFHTGHGTYFKTAKTNPFAPEPVPARQVREAS